VFRILDSTNFPAVLFAAHFPPPTTFLSRGKTLWVPELQGHHKADQFFFNPGHLPGKANPVSRRTPVTTRPDGSIPLRRGENAAPPEISVAGPTFLLTPLAPRFLWPRSLFFL